MMVKNKRRSYVSGLDKYKIGILSLGCPRNLVDSESILGKLFLKRYPIVDLDKADIGIVNTCAFIEDAKVESIDAILDLIDLKRRGRLKKIIVYGCLAQRYKDKLIKALPEVDAFVGCLSFPAMLSKEQAGSRPTLDDWRENHELKRFSITCQHYAYLKICEGCINNCSYCIIPKIKPKFNSLDINSIINKVELFDKEKVAELNIIGQDITGYGTDLYGTGKLPELLNKIIEKIRKIVWLRLLYLYPNRISDELLELLGNSPKICKYFDLPLQHVSERILRLMRRHTAKKDILMLIDKIRKKIPNVAIRTSIIVGFPSETDKEFKELMEFIEDVKFERLGVFIYSREEGTPAYNFKKQVPKKTKLERFNTLMLQQQKISQEINRRFLGQIIDVLIDEKESDFYPVRKNIHKDTNFSNGVYLGRTQYDAPEVDGLVYVKTEKELKPGDFVKVKINDTLEYDLVGETIL